MREEWYKKWKSQCSNSISALLFLFYVFIRTAHAYTFLHEQRTCPIMLSWTDLKTMQRIIGVLSVPLNLQSKSVYKWNSALKSAYYNKTKKSRKLENTTECNFPTILFFIWGKISIPLEWFWRIKKLNFLSKKT